MPLLESETVVAAAEPLSECTGDSKPKRNLGRAEPDLAPREAGRQHAALPRDYLYFIHDVGRCDNAQWLSW